MTATTPAPETEVKKAARPRNLSRILQDAQEAAAMDLAAIYYRGQHLKGFPRDEDFQERVAYQKHFQVLTLGDKYAQVEIEIHTRPEVIESMLDASMYSRSYSEVILPEWAKVAIQEYLAREPINVTKLPDQAMEYRNPGFTVKYPGAPIMVTAPDLRHPSYQMQLAAWQLVCQLLGPKHVEVRIHSITEGKVDKAKKEKTSIPQVQAAGKARRTRARIKTGDKALDELIKSMF